jgi:hypothetical protein
LLLTTCVEKKVKHFMTSALAAKLTGLEIIKQGFSGVNHEIFFLVGRTTRLANVVLLILYTDMNFYSNK